MSAKLLQSPKSIEKHKSDYRADAWLEYTPNELQQIVAYKTKLATHYTNKEKQAKALYDARNYLDMLEARLNA